MREKMLNSFLEAIRFFSNATEEMTYLCDLSSQKVYFADRYAERFKVPPMDGMAYTLEELQGFMYARNGEKVSYKLESFENLKDGILHQEYHFIDKQGKKFKVHCTEKLQFDHMGNPMWIIGHVSNIATSQRVDPLTRLFNAQQLMEDLNECLEKKQSGFLVVLGIDNFKNINHKYGRNIGNRVLKNMADALDSLLDLSLRAYRLDSDKFAINGVGCTREVVEELYHNMQEKLADQCTLSSGVAKYHPDLGESTDEIYQHAENALDSAKKNGKNKLEFFSETIYEEMLNMIDFQEELKQSVANDFAGFSISYQPQIDNRTCEICGVEALLRYHSKRRGEIAPDEFIPILEQLELIITVGEWVLSNALRQCKIWRQTLPNLRVSVNLSFVQLRNSDVYGQTLNILDELGLPGNVLTLELTESIHLQDYRFFNKIFYKFGKQGVRIAIDDFGTGYSSLSYLKSIAIDEIKIDRCFVSGIHYSAYNYRLLGNIIELAQSAKIRVCCEGVETKAELKTLKELHPDILQGYLFGKPQTVEEFEKCYIHAEAEEYKKTRQQEAQYRLLEENLTEEGYAKYERMAASSLQHMRQTEMYKAILSETIAYAEVDLETRKILDCGGLWDNYQSENLMKDNNYDEILTFYKDELIYPEDIEIYCQFFDFDMDEKINETNKTKKLQYRRNIDGVMQWVEITAHIFSEQYSENVYALIYLKNIDAEKQQKLKQEAAAARDHLTGVYNRGAFEKEVKKHVFASGLDGESTLIMLDLDNFKMINDRYGHMEGDRVLMQLADVLKATFRKRDLIGRLGGDEFLVFLKDLTDREIILRRINEFRDAFAKVNSYESTCSMGITIVKPGNFSYEKCIRKVDIALYQSKEKGKDIYSYYEDEK